MSSWSPEKILPSGFIILQEYFESVFIKEKISQVNQGYGHVKENYNVEIILVCCSEIWNHKFLVTGELGYNGQFYSRP